MDKTDQSSSILEAILEFNHDRKPKRVRLKLQRMDENPFAFFRGTDHLFACSWLEYQPPDVGPPVLICGDLHLENFGAYEAEDGEILFDINDFDEALVAPVSLDLVRCTASILIAAEIWHLTPLQAVGMALAFLDDYRRALTSMPRDHSVAEGLSLLGPGVLWNRTGVTGPVDPVSLLGRNTEFTKKGRRRIIRNEKHPPIRASRFKAIERAVEKFGTNTSTPEAYSVLDVTARILGIGSLGLPRYVVLVEGPGPADENWLLDIKAVCSPSLRSCTDAPQPDYGESEAHRVVYAQHVLQAKPMLGLAVIEIEGQWYRMRQLIPDENRASLDRLRRDPDKLREAIHVAGRVTGHSHLRGACSLENGRGRDSLIAWASRPALDTVMAAAVRCAERNRLDYVQYHESLSRPSALPKSLRSTGRPRKSK
ncbi:Uncharacterized conserved protein, DUF2252 family [Singulisphaera sp. GP187]|uniref:DUF2252 family protein n=1 Tax=Singulisphaera sp. GP187 TaxID=1882752 RepID=UPI00092B4D89|nr:DUF2252 family protein [Singulisphaera sp. GP187]SIO36022.1 Uncharacterized conserved protein, DUF2252 family [Singulisphaera sp. GP187]